MQNAVLMTHRESTAVTEGELDLLPVPAPRGPVHQPVPHAVLVQAMKGAAIARGYRIANQELALGRNGKRLFGVLDLEATNRDDTKERSLTTKDRGMSIGFRNSIDETLAIRVVAGVRVFVCDNLALSGDLIALKRRNTKGLQLENALAEGFNRYLVHAATLDEQITDLQEASISDQAARAKLFDVFAHRVLPLRLFRSVKRNYFEPDESMTDCQPRTWWGLHNACTRALKALSRPRAFEANVALGQSFGLTHQDVS